MSMGLDARKEDIGLQMNQTNHSLSQINEYTIEDEYSFNPSYRKNQRPKVESDPNSAVLLKPKDERKLPDETFSGSSHFSKEKKHKKKKRDKSQTAGEPRKKRDKSKKKHKKEA